MQTPQNSRHPITAEERQWRRHEAEQRRQAHEAGCFGLMGGWAFRRRLRRDLSAEEASPLASERCLRQAASGFAQFLHKHREYVIVGSIGATAHGDGDRVRRAG